MNALNFDPQVTDQTVFVVDDCERLRSSVSELLKTFGYTVELFAGAQDFINVMDLTRSGCLLLDLRLPDFSGLRVQERMIECGYSIPVIIVSGESTVPDAVKAMRMGCFDFIEKPYPSEYLLERVKAALDLDRKKRIELANIEELNRHFASLTEREKEIFIHVLAGQQSKWIASLLGLSVSTVDNHRANIMRKLKVKNSIDLARYTPLLPVVSRAQTS